MKILRFPIKSDNPDIARYVFNVVSTLDEVINEILGKSKHDTKLTFKIYELGDADAEFLFEFTEDEFKSKYEEYSKYKDYIVVNGAYEVCYVLHAVEYYIHIKNY